LIQDTSGQHRLDLLISDATKAREKLGWIPEYDLQTLIKEVVQSDLKDLQSEKFLKNGGFRTMNRFE
jgi:GDPmannose 4,6-dehydratase